MKVRFEFPFNLIGTSTMAFLTGQSWRVLNPGTQVGTQNKDFGLIPFLTQVRYFSQIEECKNSNGIIKLSWIRRSGWSTSDVEPTLKKDVEAAEKWLETDKISCNTLKTC